MFRFFRISILVVVSMGLIATAALWMPAGSLTVTAQSSDLHSEELADGLFEASNICDADELEANCCIDSGPCGRSWSATGCCPLDKAIVCQGVVSGSPPCLAGIAIFCVNRF